MVFKFISSILFCIFFSSVTIANASDNNELIKLLNNINTMRADFEQLTISLSNNQIIQKTTGSMILKRPGKFRWEISYPNKHLTIINGDQLSLYDIDLEQATKRKMDYKNHVNALALLIDSTEKLNQMFTITKLKTKLKDTDEFELKSKNVKNANSYYKLISMHFVSKKLKSICISDDLDQEIKINFLNTEFGLKILENKFVFVPPSNVDVLDEYNVRLIRR